jgi:AMMECR1 domain-containing protein
MGTLEPTRETLADEIVHNAVTACSRDERFPSVTVQELPMLNYWVDILGEPELVSSVDELDPTRYGVIVSTPDGRRGSVLPDEDDILSVDEQVDRACRRGGIDPQERITLQRFEVTRHQ